MRMDRREFLTSPCIAGAALVAAGQMRGPQQEAQTMARRTKLAPLVLRPYQVLCVVCSAGDEAPGRGGDEITRIAEAVREDPDRPVTLACNAGDVYVYQDPGTEHDTPEGRDYNRKRDLDILQMVNWAPGAVLPARTLFMCLLSRISTVSGICGYDAVTSDAWRGCPQAASGNYERGCAKGIDAIIPPRSEEECAREKEASVRALHAAKEVPIRPHILLCAVCQYGGGVRPPIKEDNLPELLDMILHQKPGIPITMARGADWMMCAPCPRRVPELNACVNVLGSGGLSNEKRDLDMLQVLGLTFGSTMGARDLYRLIFERIPSTAPICKREGSTCPSIWWDGCGESNLEHGNASYEAGRAELLGLLG